MLTRVTRLFLYGLAGSVLLLPAVVRPSDVPGPDTASAVFGYTANDPGNRDILLTKILPDLRIGVEIIDTPRNRFQGTLSREEIAAAIKLGVYNWAGVLPDMNVRFVDSVQNANLIFRFRKSPAAYGFLPSQWSSAGNVILVMADNTIFRLKDFISSKMSYDYFVAITDPAKPYFSDLPMDFNGDWSLLGKRHSCVPYDSMPDLPSSSTPVWDCKCITCWDSVPHFKPQGIIEPGNFAISDISLVVQHELGHALLGYHIYEGAQQKTCDSILCTNERRSDVRRRTFFDENNFIQRTALRRKHLPCITEKTSPGVLFSKGTSGEGAWNSRGIFDLDADRLAAGHAAYGRCGEKPGANEWQGYRNIAYPTIRKGWLIVLQHKHTKEKLYTNDWHFAHRMMGWVRNGNTRPVDNDWFQVDMLDDRESREITADSFFEEAFERIK